MKYYKIILILPFCLLLMCTRSVDSLERRDFSEMFAIDLQDGFKSDSIEIMIDGLIFFRDTITSESSSGFARRIKGDISAGYHNLGIHHLSLGTEENKDFYLLDTLVLGILYDSLGGNFVINEYEYFPQYPSFELNDFNHIRISLVQYYLWADFMPAIPPDPVEIAFWLELKNEYEYKIISEIEFKRAQVYVDSSNEWLGVIDFMPHEDVLLLPAYADTIYIEKVTQDTLPFYPPCNNYAYFKIEIWDRYNNQFIYLTDSLYFECGW